MLVSLRALGDAKVLSFALGDAKVPNANDFVSQWNIGLKLYSILMVRNVENLGFSNFKVFNKNPLLACFFD